MTALVVIFQITILLIHLFILPVFILASDPGNYNNWDNFIFFDHTWSSNCAVILGHSDEMEFSFAAGFWEGWNAALYYMGYFMGYWMAIAFGSLIISFCMLFRAWMRSCMSKLYCSTRTNFDYVPTSQAELVLPISMYPELCWTVSSSSTCIWIDFVRDFTFYNFFAMNQLNALFIFDL